MYQALYRKYRPSTFDDVYGQEIITKILKNAIKYNKISHAYLFTGPRGTGKTSIAKIFARTINCLEPIDITPCNKCVCCTQKNNTDIIEIDAASNNGVDEIREIKEKVNLVPSIGKYKIYIIDEVHMLTIGAFNALLKTLEEPPEHVIFILATTEPHKIPSTILSRCQRYDFKKISENKIYERLKYIINEENISINDDAIKEIARLSDGGLRDAISILDQVIAYSDENITEEDIHNINGTLTQYQLKNIIDSIIEKNLENALTLINEYDEKGKNLVKLTEEIILFLKNILVNKNLNIDVELYKNYVNKITNENLYKYILEFNNSIYEMKKSENSKLLLELAMIKIMNYKEEKNEILINENINNKLEINNDIKNEIKTEKITNENIKKIEFKDNEKLEKLKKIRIDNTLSHLNKKNISIIKEKILTLREKMLISSYGEFISMILDAEIKATSDNYIIFVFQKDLISKKFNENLDKIEKLFIDELNEKYYPISVDDIEWEKIKNEFNSKTKEYTLISDNALFNEIFEKKENNELETLFADVVQYQ